MELIHPSIKATGPECSSDSSDFDAWFKNLAQDIDAGGNANTAPDEKPEKAFDVGEVMMCRSLPYTKKRGENVPPVYRCTVNAGLDLAMRHGRAGGLGRFFAYRSDLTPFEWRSFKEQGSSVAPTNLSYKAGVEHSLLVASMTEAVFIIYKTHSFEPDRTSVRHAGNLIIRELNPTHIFDVWRAGKADPDAWSGEGDEPLIIVPRIVP